MNLINKIIDIQKFLHVLSLSASRHCVFAFVFAALCLTSTICPAIMCSYDSLSRLTRVDYGNGVSIAYTYDAAGNRLTLEAHSNPDAFLVIKPASTNISAWGFEREIAVTANIPWTAAINQPWLSITSGGSGTTNGTVRCMVEDNRGASSRTGQITVAGGGITRTCTVVQAGSALYLSWTMGGDVGWYWQTEITHSGWAARNGQIVDNQQSWMETTVTGPGTVSFWLKVSSEVGHDFLRFQIGGNEQTNVSGNVDWRLCSFDVPAGSQKIRWSYVKDSSTSVGADAGWVDQIVWMPGVGMWPAGGQSIADRRSPFTWAPVYGAFWYQLWITRNGQTYLTPWVEGATAWLPSTSGLPGGNYQWWVRPWGSAIGFGPWSPMASFSIPVTTPWTLTQTAPTGVQASYNLTYRWNKDANATWYRLWVGRTGAGTWHDRWFELSGAGVAAENPGGTYPGPAKPVLSAPTGTIGDNQPTFQWSGGECTWWLNSWGPDGYGPWAGPKAFSIPHPAGTWYRVYANRGATPVLDQWTNGTNLPAPFALSSGAHSWWLGVYDAQTGQTIWSDRADFTVP